MALARVRCEGLRWSARTYSLLRSSLPQDRFVFTAYPTIVKHNPFPLRSDNRRVRLNQCVDARRLGYS